MITTEEVVSLLGQPEGTELEYKTVLPPSKSIAQLISSFANANGGYIILGVSETRELKGLSEDFHANEITNKALNFLSPIPKINAQYITHNGKKIFAIKVEKSDIQVSTENKIYKRIGTKNQLLDHVNITFKRNGYARIKDINRQFEEYKEKATISKIKLIEHYQSILKIIDDLSHILYPEDAETPTNNQEGKILTRILFSSFVDNFETYLSDLLYEIFLANPKTLKTQQQVTLEEVLKCSDLQEFVIYWAKERISKLQKGSVKGFIQENKQISQLSAIDESEQSEIEKILQIRHLYSHRNGTVDEKFLQYFNGEFTLNSEHQMPISGICDKLCYLAKITDKIDSAAKTKYKLG